MCDCYAEPCKVCGELLPMHLGDFKTARWEIAILCEKHVGYFPKIRRVLWSPWLEVLSLTENAWGHRMQNHPNIGETEIISIPIHSCTFCSRLYNTEDEANKCRTDDIKSKKEWNKFLEGVSEQNE